MRKTLTMALIAGALLLAPLAVKANTLTDTFTVPIDLSIPTIQAGTGLSANLVPYGLSLFNPADGTLTGVSVTIEGAFVWTSDSFNPRMQASFNFPLWLTGAQTFNAIGNGYLYLTGTSTGSTDLGDFTGQGDYNGDLLSLQVYQDETGDIITAAPFTGTITYDYTQAATTPEPASLLLFGTGLLGLAYFVRRRQKHGAAEL